MSVHVLKLFGSRERWCRLWPPMVQLEHLAVSLNFKSVSLLHCYQLISTELRGWCAGDIISPFDFFRRYCVLTTKGKKTLMFLMFTEWVFYQGIYRAMRSNHVIFQLYYPLRVEIFKWAINQINRCYVLWSTNIHNHTVHDN